MVNIQHVKHSIDFGLAQVSGMLHESNKLHI